jgi:2-keto-4-pentenoate hydratase/2-oxohepta-3-ene-1,7-dioic acid hydratase in catechol pathway
MRLVRYGDAGAEGPGLLDDAGQLRDVSRAIDDVAGEALAPDALAQLRGVPAGEFPIVPDNSRLGPPVAGIGKIVGVGLNYRDHAAEAKMPVPTEPTLFLKATSALCGPDDDTIIPREATSVDWEVELGVVIGLPGVYISERDALAHVAGYCVGIDFSEREFQFNRGGQGFKGKSADSFAPLGPWLVTADAIDPQNLALRLSVNGVGRQDGNTRDMIFPVAALIAYISRFMSLQAGDVILTGTPAGVGMGMAPKTYLKPGDVVEATIAGLGTQRHRVVASS